MANNNEALMSSARAGEELLARGRVVVEGISVACEFTGTEWRPRYTVSGKQGESEVFGGSAITLGGAFNCLPMRTRRIISTQLRTT